MNQVDLKFETRGKQSKNENRRSRRAGKIPAVIYGSKKESRAIFLDGEQLNHELNHIHSSTILNLREPEVEEPEQAIIRAIQRDPVTNNPLHIDFWRVERGKHISVSIPVHGVGTPDGIKQGGVLQTQLRYVELKVLPFSVPEYLELDISGMDVGDSLHVSDLDVPDGMEILTNDELVLFFITVPRGLASTTEEGEGEEGEGEEGAAEGEGKSSEGESEG